MPADIATSAAPQTTTDIPSAAATPSDGGSGAGSNRTLVIALSTVLSAVGLVLLTGALILFWRARQRRIPFLSRGVSPIDDEEIERWKGHRGEKLTGGYQTGGGDTDAEADAPFHKETLVGGGGSSPTQPSHAKHSSRSSAKKPPSVIVYNNNHSPNLPRHSTDAESRRSFVQNHPAYASSYPHHSHSYSGGASGKTSFDINMKALPQTPIQARAPNSRAGLTDESIPGDEPFLPSPKRTASRLSKHPPATAATGGSSGRHARGRSSRSSTRSFGDYYPFYGTTYGGGGGGKEGGGSEVELSPTRHSHEHVHQQVRRSSGSSRSRSRSYGGGGAGGNHSRVYSSSSIPPRLSFGEDGGAAFAAAGLSSPPPPTAVRSMRVGGVGEREIGRAIG